MAPERLETARGVVVERNHIADLRRRLEQNILAVAITREALISRGVNPDTDGREENSGQGQFAIDSL